METTFPVTFPELTRRGLAGTTAFVSLPKAGMVSPTKSKLALYKGCGLLCRGIGRRVGKLLLPLENSCASRRSFRFGDASCPLQRNRKTGLRQRVTWSERCQGGRCRYCGFELLSIAQGANQPMMRFNMLGVNSNRLAKGSGRA